MILIIEDNPVNRDVLGRRLERKGFTVRFAEDGPSGITATNVIQPDLILMDIGLGEMDGWQVTRHLKKDPATSAIPIIALTASAFETDRIKSMEAGCCDFDTKPVDLPRLLMKMDIALKNAAMLKAS